MDQYYDSARFRKILKSYEEMRDFGVSNFLDADDLTDVAEFYHMNGRLTDAMEVIDYALRIFPGSTQAIAFKARVALLTENNPRKAALVAEEIADKSDVEYTFLKAEIMVAEHRAEEADRYLQERLDNFEGDEEDYFIDVANIFADYDEMELAEQWLRRSSLTDDDDYKDLCGRILQSKGLYEESEELFNELIDRNPYSNVYWNRLAASQLMRNSIRDSISSSEYSIAINPNDDEAILNKANGLFSLSNYKEALKYYRKFCQLQPNSDTGKLFVGITLANLNRMEEARKYMEEALVLAEEGCKNGKPVHGTNIMQVLQELAFLESRLGNRQEAMEYLQRMDELGGDRHLINVARGYVCLEQGDGIGAEMYFKTAVEESDSSPEVMLQIGIAAFDNSLIKTAGKMFSMLLASVPEEWADGYAYYARCCYEAGDMEMYDTAMRVAVIKNPMEARLVLADLYPEGTEPEEYPLISLESGAGK